MIKFISGACAAVMALTLPLSTPAMALPMASPDYQQPSIIKVQQNEYRGYDPRYRHRGFERRGDRYYYNGHRGYRDYRRGYRHHNGFWFPPAAFIAGAIIGGAIANQQPPVQYRPRGGNAHVDWCYSRYRSYRASDNTFQPYNGPRRQCYSPYS